MAKKKSGHRRISKKQARLETQAKASRMRLIRIGGVIVLVILAFAAIYFWRNAGGVTAEEAASLVAPNIIGSPDAPAQIVEFGDFGCPSCRAWHNRGIKDQLIAAYGDQVSFEFKHFPVITAQSPAAAEAGQCAAEQDAFWAYHDYIYEQTPQNALSNSDLKQYAAALELDQAAFDACLDSGRFEEFVLRDWRAARDAGARGTPTFLINGRQVSFSFQAMSAAIDDILG